MLREVLLRIDTGMIQGEPLGLPFRVHGLQVTAATVRPSCHATRSLRRRIERRLRWGRATDLTDHF